jgi:hypothetical protein
MLHLLFPCFHYTLAMTSPWLNFANIVVQSFCIIMRRRLSHTSIFISWNLWQLLGSKHINGTCTLIHAHESRKKKDTCSWGTCQKPWRSLVVLLKGSKHFAGNCFPFCINPHQSLPKKILVYLILSPRARVNKVPGEKAFIGYHHFGLLIIQQRELACCVHTSLLQF